MAAGALVVSPPTRVFPFYSFRPVGGWWASCLLLCRWWACAMFKCYFRLCVPGRYLYTRKSNGLVPFEHIINTPARCRLPVRDTRPNMLDRCSTRNNGPPASGPLACTAAGTTWTTVHIVLRPCTIWPEHYRALWACRRKFALHESNDRDISAMPLGRKLAHRRVLRDESAFRPSTLRGTFTPRQPLQPY